MGMTLLDLKGVWDHIGDGISNVIGTILWGLCDIFFLLIDLCQILFRKFAGLDTINVDGVKVEGDVIIYLLESNVVQDVFFSLLILSFFLLVIFTLFAVVKNMYSDKPKAPISIIANSMKGMLNYLMVPVCVVVGLAVGNVILQAVDGATKTHAGDVSASSMLFEAATYNANKLRSGSLDNRREDFAYMLDKGYLDNMLNDLEPIFGTSNKDALIKKAPFAQESDLNLAAGVLDSAFTRGVLRSNPESNWEKYDPIYVFEYYNALRVSYITIWVGGGFLLYCLFNITWGLLRRIFKMVLGYCMTPVFISLYPMDDGNALKAWIKDFSKQATSAYAAVGVMNVFYSVLPFIRDINFMGGSGTGIFDQWVQLLVMISGYLLVKDMIGTVSGWVGTGDALADGKAASGALMKPIKDTFTKTTGAFAGLVGGAGKAGKVGKSKFFGALTGAYKGAGLDAKLDPTKLPKWWEDGKKAGEDYYEAVKTNPIVDTRKGDRAKAAKDRFAYAELMDREAKEYKKEVGLIDTRLAAEIEAVNSMPEAELDAAGKLKRIEELRAGAEKMKKSKMAESTAAKILTSGEAALLEKGQKDLEKKQRYLSPAESLYRANAAIENYILGAELRDDMSSAEISDALEAVKSGNRSRLEALVGRSNSYSVMERYEKYSEQIAEQENIIADAFESAFEMASTDKRALKELERVFEFQERTLSDGKKEIVGVVKNLAGITEKYKIAATELKKEAADLEARTDSLKEKKASIGAKAFEGELSSAEIAAIEKGVPKK